MPIAPLVLVAALAAPSAPGSAVSRLGPDSDYRSVAAVARLGCAAVPELTRQLSYVRPERMHFYDGARHAKAMRVLWSLAALRAITGKDFYAPDRSLAGSEDARAQMLRMGAPAGSSKLFGIWPSRGRIYFAGRVQQSRIIRQWRAFAASGRCTGAGATRDAEFWVYGTRAPPHSN
jgi:hypothetical protein